MCLSFLLYAVILGYLIAMQFRSDLQLTAIGMCLIISGKLQKGLSVLCVGFFALWHDPIRDNLTEETFERPKNCEIFWINLCESRNIRVIQEYCDH